MRIATLDLETNGFKGKSVLSASSIVFDTDGRVIDIFNRFYYPVEKPDPETFSIHGLDNNRISWMRNIEKYPSYFMEDEEALGAFWDLNEVEWIIVHNLSFDTSFLTASLKRKRNWWCSMKGLTDFCSIPGRGRLRKWPRLDEARKIARKKLATPLAVKEIEERMPARIPHSSLSDCFDLYGILSRIYHSCPECLDFKPERPAVYLGRDRGNIPPILEFSSENPDRFILETMTYAHSLANLCQRRDQAEKISQSIAIVSSLFRD